MNFIASYIIIVGVVTHVILVSLQISAFLKTRHLSLAALAVSSALGLLYGLTYLIAWRIWASGHNPQSLYLLSAALLALQSIIGVLSVFSLYRAYERALAARPSA